MDWTRDRPAKKVIEAAEIFPTKFPEDSFKHPSEALKTILTDAEGFLEQSKALGDAGQALAAAAEAQDEEAFKAAFGDYQATCKSCHSDYRMQ